MYYDKILRELKIALTISLLYTFSILWIQWYLIVCFFS